MKISILKENFLKGLSIVSKATSKSFTLPVLNNVLLSTEKNFLKISGTDLELSIEYWALAKIEKEGAIMIPAKFLISLISFIAEEKINLEVKNNTLFLEGKNYKNQVKGLGPEDFPIIPEIKSELSLEINSQDLTQGLTQIVEMASSSQTRPEISGIYLCLGEDSIEMAATDSFRLAEKKITIPKSASFSDKISLIVLQKTIKEVINIFGETSEPIKIFFSPNQIMFESKMKEVSHPEVHVTSRLIEGEYPNYKEIIPKDFKTNLVLSRQEFLNQIKAASLFSGKVNEVKIKVSPEQEIVEIFAQNPDLGQSKSQMKGKIKGEKTEISFNYRFLIDGLNNIKSKEIVFELNGEEGPGVLRPIDDKKFIYVVMPIKST
jgi:DNA polymerase III subunit beta